MPVFGNGGGCWRRETKEEGLMGVESYVTALLGTQILTYKQSHTHTHSTAADGQRTEGRS